MLRIPSPVCYSPAERGELDAMLHSDHFGPGNHFSEPFSLLTAPQNLRAGRFFCQPFAYSIIAFYLSI